jgi:hypothetical protein
MTTTTDTRLASDKQKLFINSLLDTKEHSFEKVDVDNLDMKSAKSLISTLLKLRNKDVVRPATPKQIAFATALVQKKEGGLALLNHYLRNSKVNSIEQLDKTDVSLLIGQLMVANEVKPPMKINEVGAYLLNQTIYSIRKNDRNYWSVWTYSDVAKKYVRNDSLRDVLYQLEPSNRLTLELAIKYSAQVGICVHCGRTLTLLKSVAGGMGAYCAKKYH